MKNNRPQPPQGISSEEARAMLDEDKRRRVAGAAKALEEVQQEWRVRFVNLLVVRDGQISQGVEIVALD